MIFRRILWSVILVASATGVATAEHADVRPRVADGKIVTDGHIDETSTTIPGLRVFGYDFQEDPADPYFASDPGFNAIAGSGLPGGSELRFNIPSGATFGLPGNLTFWDGADSDPALPGVQVQFGAVPNNESLRLNLGSNNVTIRAPLGELSGFSIQTVTATGAVHRHLNSFLDFGSAAVPAEGIYLVPLELTSTESAIQKSDPLFFLYNNGRLEEEHDLAIEWVEANLASVPPTWNVDANGNWSQATNWTGSVPNAASAEAAFAGIITQPRTVTVDIPITVGDIEFDSANAYTIAGPGSLQLNGGGQASIQVVNGSHTISAPFSIATGNIVAKTGPGTLTISGPQNHGAGAVLIANAGVLNLNSDGGQNLFVQANAPVNFGSSQHLAVLNIGAGSRATMTTGGNKVLVSNVPTIAGTTGAWTGTLDASDNDAVFRSSAATKSADFSRLYDQVKIGFGAGNWTGRGITSSTAAGNANADTGLALVDNALLGNTTFSGQPVTADSILLKYTYYGDIDQNGQVDADDLTVFASNFGRTTGATQIDGDIDFNGAVNADDLTVFANNFNKGVGNPLAVTHGSVQAVPEPGSLVLAVLCAASILAGLALRRHRCSVNQSTGVAANIS
jgi:hypothetical protein